MRLRLPVLLALVLLAPPATAQKAGFEDWRVGDLWSRWSAEVPAELGEEGAIARLEEVRGDSPDSAAVHFALAEAYALAQQWAAAEEAARRARELQEDLPGVDYLLALLALQQNQASAAWDWFDRAGRRESVGPEVPYARVISGLRSGELDELGEARGLLENLFARGLWDRRVFSLWLALNPKSEELEETADRLADRESGWAALFRSEILIRQGEFRRAIDSLQGLISAEDSALAGRVSRALAWAYFQLEDWQVGGRYYDSLLSTLDEETGRLLYQDVTSLLREDEKEEYGEMADRPGDFFRVVWRRRDATPGTPENERLRDHYRRLQFVLEHYALQTTGDGYFIDQKRFQRFSPDLEYYGSTPLFDRTSETSQWVEHRGLIYLRHGNPDLRVSASGFGVDPNESWLYSKGQPRPLVFHFVRRRGIGEYTLSLNLGLATQEVAFTADAPREVIRTLSSSFRQVYARRGTIDPFFENVAEVRTYQRLLEFLISESQFIAAATKTALATETFFPIPPEKILPVSVYSATFRTSEGKSRTELYYAFPLTEEEEGLKEIPVDATVVLYQDDWLREVSRLTERYRVRVGEEVGRGIIRRVDLGSLDPGIYEFGLQALQAGTQRMGIQRGRLYVDYFGPEGLAISDLLVRAGDQGDRTGPDATYPMVTRLFPKDKPIEVSFEVYNVPDDGEYQVDYHLLTLTQKPTFLEQLLGIGMRVAGIFFPYQTFLASVGLFGIDILTTGEKEGLKTIREEAQAVAEDGGISEHQVISTEGLREGLYQVYVTVRSMDGWQRMTRSFRFAIHDF